MTTELTKYIFFLSCTKNYSEHVISGANFFLYKASPYKAIIKTLTKTPLKKVTYKSTLKGQHLQQHILTMILAYILAILLVTNKNKQSNISNC